MELFFGVLELCDDSEFASFDLEPVGEAGGLVIARSRHPAGK